VIAAAVCGPDQAAADILVTVYERFCRGKSRSASICRPAMRDLNQLQQNAGIQLLARAKLKERRS